MGVCRARVFKQRPPERLVPDPVRFRVLTFKPQVDCTRACELTQKAAAEGRFAHWAGRRNVLALPVGLLTEGKITSKVAEHRDHVIRLVIVHAHSPQTAASEVAVLNA